MAEYTVIWEMPIFDGESPIEAAKRAREIQLDPLSIATFFTVKNTETGEETAVDLEKLKED